VTSISPAGLNLIKDFEGLRLSTYKCASGIDTIGYGSTGSHVKPGMQITQSEADALLAKDLVRFEQAVDSAVKVPINQSQFDALVSFAFNCGVGALQESTLLRLLNQRDYIGAAAQFDRWVKGPNGPLPGLVRRRDAEEALFRKDGLTGAAAKTPPDQEPVKHKVFKITAKQDTVLKKAPVASTDLEDDQKVAVVAGKEYQCVWRGKTDNDHVKLSLDYGLGNWYVYAPHWSGLADAAPASNPPPAKIAGEVLLPTPYYSQRDNIPSGNDMPYRTCFSSSCAMLAVTLKPGCITGDDDYIKKRQPRGDSTDSMAQVKTLKSLGINARFATNCNNDTIKKQIDKGIPVPVGILHHGPAGAPSGGGHWLTVVGYNGNGFICNDPWGEINHANGTYTKTNGKQVLYSYKLFDSRWTVAGSSDGWAILVD
jgi:GH24 family phage-related lysozyme (muramidase)